MDDDLLPYYNRELQFVHELAAEFAALHPDEAAALRISANAVDDPHVERLIQAFALLCARIRHRIDDDFPELTDAVLGHLYPHYLNPLPSMAIVQARPAASMNGSYTLPKHSEIETEPVQRTALRYRTGFPLTLWPLTVAAASLSGLPLEAPANPAVAQGTRAAEAVLRISLTLLDQNAALTDLADAWDRAPSRNLRLFLAGQRSLTFPLYERLFNHTVSVAVATGPKDPEPVILSPEVVTPVGFAADEGLLPYGPRSFVGYRLLTEYFACPEKFLFVDVGPLPAAALARGGRSVDLFFYLDKSDPELEKAVNAETFALGCTPMVNLFRHPAEPFPLTQNRHDYPVQPDRRRVDAYEVYSVDRVIASERGRQVALRPFFACNHANERDLPGPFWQPVRRRSSGTKPGTEVLLNFVDLAFEPNARAGWTVSVETTCLNRDLPNNLPFGGGRPDLQLSEGAAEIERIVCLTQPTPTRRMPQRDGARWRLLSHLSLNHLSLLDSGSGDGSGAEALREMLRLYDVRESEATRRSIDAVRRISHRRGLARVPFAAHTAFAYGLDIEIEFDRAGFPGRSPFLLAAVLERFLGTYASINAFCRLTARITGQEDRLRTWAPRAGDRILV